MPANKAKYAERKSCNNGNGDGQVAFGKGLKNWVKRMHKKWYVSADGWKVMIYHSMLLLLLTVCLYILMLFLRYTTGTELSFSLCTSANLRSISLI